MLLSSRPWHLSWILQRPSEHCESRKSGTSPFSRQKRDRQVLEAPGDRDAGGARRSHTAGGWGLGAAGAARARLREGETGGFPGASPRSRLQASGAPLQAPQQAGDTPLGGSPAGGGNAPRPQHQPGGLPAPCPAAVSDPRSRTPSPGGFPSQTSRPQPLDLLPHLLLDGGRRGPNFPGGARPRPFPGWKVSPPPTLRAPLRFRGTSAPLAGRKRGDCEERTSSP